jgi:SpoOM protein
MAKCDLSIELDDPQAVYPGGGTIKGVVRVTVDANVKCSGLVVTSNWKTHGRGNVASEEFGEVTLFAGEWRAGEKSEYRFELPIGNWPPSYHGHYLNIDHYIDARVKIPWAFDPKASHPFQMRPTCGVEGVTSPTRVVQANVFVKFIFVIVLMGMLIGGLAVIALAGVVGLFFLLLPLGGFGYWFLRHFLPKYALGDVQCDFGSAQASPGESVTGELLIRPRKAISIGGVSLSFEAREECVSGSGSSRTTHRHTLFEQSHVLQGAIQLTPGNEHRFPFQVELPQDAPYSVDLDDNDLIWSATLRVDIPRWPDWVKVALPRPTQPTPLVSAPPVSSAEITFQETAQHLDAVRGNRQQLEALVEAVSGLTFDIEAIVERRLLYSGEDDPHLYQGGYAVWAHFPDPELPLVLYVPRDWGDEFEQMNQGICRGRGTVVGWDHLHDRLQVKLESPVRA